MNIPHTTHEDVCQVLQQWYNLGRITKDEYAKAVKDMACNVYYRAVKAANEFHRRFFVVTAPNGVHQVYKRSLNHGI